MQKVLLHTTVHEHCMGLSNNICFVIKMHYFLKLLPYSVQIVHTHIQTFWLWYTQKPLAVNQFGKCACMKKILELWWRARFSVNNDFLIQFWSVPQNTSKQVRGIVFYGAFWSCIAPLVTIYMEEQCTHTLISHFVFHRSKKISNTLF